MLQHFWMAFKQEHQPVSPSRPPHTTTDCTWESRGLRLDIQLAHDTRWIPICHADIIRVYKRHQGWLRTNGTVCDIMQYQVYVCSIRFQRQRVPDDKLRLPSCLFSIDLIHRQLVRSCQCVHLRDNTHTNTHPRNIAERSRSISAVRCVWRELPPLHSFGRR